MTTPAPLGLIAGRGGLPLEVCKHASAKGLAVRAVAFEKDAAEPLYGNASVSTFRLGQAGKVFDYLKEGGVEHVVMIGKFDKKLAFADLMPDWRGAKILADLAMNKQDSNIMLRIIKELESEGFTVDSQADWLADLFPPAGTLGKRQPDKRVQADIEYGLDICRDLAGKDIGQTIIVKDATVIAVEAAEGSDETIRRGCHYAGKGAVMIKTSRPGQDPRFDIPGIGPETARLLAEGSAAALAVEAGRVLVSEREETVQLCNKAGLALVAV